MGSVHRVDAPRLVEPFGVPEIFYSGIGAARLIGDGTVELLCFRLSTPAEYRGEPERRVVARMIRPIAGIAEDFERVQRAIAALQNPPRLPTR